IRKICDNYSRMSFNVGPTVLSWMQEKAPRCYQAILEADRKGQERFSGHGPAMAQVYNHLIMPLANRRDKLTQVLWGIEDFKSRFGRDPEGMWLAETAVDTETLEILTECGIAFTVLAPKQAAAIRPKGAAAWEDVRGERIDTTRAYRCPLPSGREIALFFYDGSISQSIAFGGLLNDGFLFARRLIDAHHRPGRPTLSHVATDGESYGHHHAFGDMALAYCLETIDSGSEALLTIYGEFLSFYPPEYDVRIVENSSWSCAHGVERWRSDCGCNAGTPGYHQRWRGPLRAALDWLRDQLSTLFEAESTSLLRDPWSARDDYIRLILDRTPDNAARWTARHSLRKPSPSDRSRILQLMEMQRNALLMYTSCGWFFDDISRIEPVQILRYAARAIELARGLSGVDLEPEFLKLLKKAPGNLPEFEDGERVYSLLVKPSRFSSEQLAAHYGLTSLFPSFPTDVPRNCWEVEAELSLQTDERKGSLAFSAGVLRIVSLLTEQESSFLVAANYRGGISMVCGVAPEKALRQLKDKEMEELRDIFADSQDKRMVERFGHNIFSMRHILIDSQRSLLDNVLQRDIALIEDTTRSLIRDYNQLLDYMTTLKVSPPPIISSAAEITLTTNILNSLKEDLPDLGEQLERHLRMAQKWKIKLDTARIGFAVTDWLRVQMEKLCEDPGNLARIQHIHNLLTLFLDSHNWSLNLYEAQNLYHDLRIARQKELAQFSSEQHRAFHHLGRRLRFSEEALQLSTCIENRAKD
ncbi:MAG: DUF3536 domain-containing protein, partial [Fretibacterium sp.]|nr:DUF3536 domain-containing protein [Fretibacterium sp.]